MSAPSPGWYADPSGQGVWRYWDGAAWTEHRSPAAPPAAPAPAPEPLLPPLGDSTLLYLFASRLYKGRPLVGLRVPCPPRRVNGPQLATEMLALAWWSLREAGAVRLEAAVGQRRSRLQGVLLNPQAGSDRRGHQSLESELVRLAMQEGNRVNVGGMNTHFQSSDEAPYGSHEIARFARNEGAARGFLSPLAAGGLPLRGDCERIAQLEPRFDALWERWKRFAASEQPLHELLMADASSSVPGYWG